MGIIFAILIFSFIVFFHELGHFTLAKKNGIDVEEFAIGMGPTFVSKEYKGTDIRCHLLPIGGFVQWEKMMKRQSHLETSIINLYGQEFQSLQQDRFLTLFWHLFSL